MKCAFPAMIELDVSDGVYLVNFPDIKGALTYGDTLDHAIEMAQDALSGVLASRLDYGEPIPRPSTREGKGIFWVEPDADIVAPLLMRWSREDAGLTLEEVARRMGVTYQAVQKLERPGNPSVKTLARAAKALGRRLSIAM